MQHKSSQFKIKINSRPLTPSHYRQTSKELTKKDSISKLHQKYDQIRSARDRSSPKQAFLQFKQLQHKKIFKGQVNIRSKGNLCKSNLIKPEQQIQGSIKKKGKVTIINMFEMSADAPENQYFLNVPGRVLRQHTRAKTSDMRAKTPDPSSFRETKQLVEYFFLQKKLRQADLILKIVKAEEGKDNIQRKNLQGYWPAQNKFVSLIPLEQNEKVTFIHEKILPIYAEVTIDRQRYVISDEYQNCSLHHLIEQFGHFGELLSKRYLKQIAQGLQHMHKHHRRGHNRLTTNAILYNKEGQLFINAINATSLIPTKQELVGQELHYFSPEFLQSKGTTKSLKNDIWALGCIAIQMLTASPLVESIYHPYNFAISEDNMGSRMMMVDNLKKLLKVYFQSIANCEQRKGYATSKKKEIILSQVSISFINSCLMILQKERPTVDSLLEHEFFEGV